MIITIQPVEIGNSNFKKHGERVNILVNDELKYIGDCSDLFHRNIQVRDANNQIPFSIKREKSFFYSFTTDEKRILVDTIKGRRNYRIIDNGQNLEVRGHLAEKYTRYPIYLDGKEIAEGVYRCTSKNFKIDFNVYLLDFYERHLDAICLFCIFLFFRVFIYDLASSANSYGFEVQITKPEFEFDKEWLRNNFNIDLN